MDHDSSPARAARVTNRRRSAALFTAALLYFAALYSYVPSLPAYVEQRTSSLTAVGVVLAMYGLWMAFLRMPLGVLTDATGRSKPYLVAGVLLAGIGALVMSIGRSIGVLAAGRALTGVSAAAWVPFMVVFAELFPPERAIFATSLLSFASSFGQMVGTSSTGFLESWGGFGMTFTAAAVLAAVATVIVVLVSVPRRDEARRAEVSARSIRSIFTRSDVLAPSFANALCQFGVWAVTFGFMPILARRLGADSVAVGFLMTLNIVANTVANLLATFIVRQDNRKLLLYASFLAFAVGTAVAALARGVAPLFISSAVTGLANGLFFPILLGMSIENVDGAHRSTAMGIHQSVYAIGMFTGPWIGGVISDALGIRAMFGIVACFCLIAPAALLILWRPFDQRALRSTR